MVDFPVKGLGNRLLAGAVLSHHTTWRIGGVARWLVHPASVGELAEIMATTRDWPRLLLGGGSNLLLADEGFSGLVISLSPGMGFVRLDSPGVVVAGGGCTTRSLAHFARRHGLTGVEFLAGIPGRVGGAVIMNAGAYGGDISQVLQGAMLMDENGGHHWQQATELALSYRSSGIPAGWVVTEAHFSLQPAESETIRQKMVGLNRQRVASQPLKWPSAGSTFKNPPHGAKAWALIEAAGLRGVTIGGAQVAEKHCNFLINRGGATGEDMRRLIRRVWEGVLASSGISLELEVKVVEVDGRPWLV